MIVLLHLSSQGIELQIVANPHQIPSKGWESLALLQVPLLCVLFTQELNATLQHLSCGEQWGQRESAVEMRFLKTQAFVCFSVDHSLVVFFPPPFLSYFLLVLRQPFRSCASADCRAIDFCRSRRELILLIIWCIRSKEKHYGRAQFSFYGFLWI